MSQLKLLRFLIIAIIIFCNNACVTASTTKIGANWSKEAYSLEYESGKRWKEISSPDGEKTAIIDGVNLYLKADGRMLPGLETVGASTLAEIGWSPNSNAFFLTESLGGAVGEWRVTVYLIEDGKVRVVDVSEEIMKEFEKHYECKEQEVPNIGAIKWIDEFETLLLVAEVPPHSSCTEMGKIRGYLVAVPSVQILKEFDEPTLRKKWGEFLGERFDRK